VRSVRLDSESVMVAAANKFNYGTLWTKSAGLVENFDELISGNEQLAKHLTST